MLRPKNKYNIAYTLKFNDGSPEKTNKILNITDDSEVFILKTIAWLCQVSIRGKLAVRKSLRSSFGTLISINFACL